MPDKEQPQMPKSTIEFSRDPDFQQAYANNVSFESSLWDLRMVFGQNDPGIGPNAVVQHTAISIPWPQVKLMKYFLDSNIKTYEIQHGKIDLQPNLVLEVPREVPTEILALDPKATEIFAAMRRHYEEFVSENPELISHPQAKAKK